MPFKSEAQRRYLWANEPEIARDWTDTYGSRIQKSNGGIMDVASDGELIDRFKNYKKGKQVTVPTSFQARSHSTPVNLAYITDEEAGILKALKPGVPHDGPMHIPNYNDYDPDRGFRSGAAMSAAESGKHTSDTLASNLSNQDIQNIRSGAIAAGAGQVVNPSFFGPKNTVSKEELARAKAFAPGAYRATRGSRFGIGSLLGGLVGLIMGIPGLGLGINALKNLPKHGTLSDWWKSKDQWNPNTSDPVDYSDMSKFRNLPLGGTAAFQNLDIRDKFNRKTMNIDNQMNIDDQMPAFLSANMGKGNILNTPEDENIQEYYDIYQGGYYP